MFSKLLNIYIFNLYVPLRQIHYSVFNYVEDPVRCERGKTFVYDALEKGQLQPTVDKVFPMEGYIDAWNYLRETRKSHGKVMIAVTNNATKT